MSDSKKEFNNDPSLLLRVEQLRPLASFPFSTRPISDHLHSIGYGWYVLVDTRDFIHDGFPKDTPRLCMVVWAVDLTSAILVTGCVDIVHQLSTEAPNQLPRAEILVAAKGWSYGDLLESNGMEVFERASYGSDGVLKYVELVLPNVHVYFRSSRKKKTEMPFAISIVGPRPVWWLGLSMWDH